MTLPHVCSPLGSMNDISIVDSSSTMGRILSIQFPPRIDYVINDKTSNLPYWLGDRIHPSWPILPKRIRDLSAEKDKLFLANQGAVQKDS